MLIDTHCHLDFRDFDLDRDSVIERAKEKGVIRIINVGSSIEGSHRAVELARKYDIVYASIGIHPHEADSATDGVIDDLKILGREKKVVAIGEVGLDYYRNSSTKKSQAAAFKRFIGLARQLKLPLIIHSREADSDILEILKTEKGKDQTGVVHCFSGSKKFLKECLDFGFYVSFTCNLTFKNAKALRELAKFVPIESVLLETDAPFLAPEGMRGKRNEPSYLAYLANEWSSLSGLSKDDIERITTHNANKLFKLGLEEKESKIAYEIRGSLYLNITNVCTNDCYFCVRTQTDFVKGHNLKLDKEPTAEDLLMSIGDIKKYKEIVFCGYGEPTTRLDVVKRVSKELKAKGATLRLVTNGHGDLINKRPIAEELVGLIDKVSVSLNTDNEDLYNKACKPVFGAQTYSAVMKFIRSCVDHSIKTEVTCLNLAGVDLKECERKAKDLGASFRPRAYGVTG
jgi:TatD DNase family protein